MGTTIIEAKIVGSCSKHGGDVRNKYGERILNKDIFCIECSF